MSGFQLYPQCKGVLFILQLWVQFICIKYFLTIIKFLPRRLCIFFFSFLIMQMYYENALSFCTKLFQAIKIVTISSNESLLEQLFISIGIFSPLIVTIFS